MKPTVDSFSSPPLRSSPPPKPSRRRRRRPPNPPLHSLPYLLLHPLNPLPSSSPASVPSSSPAPSFASVFDLDGECKITQRELEVVLLRLGQDPPIAEKVARMVADVNRDGNGDSCISFEEFAALEAALGPAAAADEDDGAAELREAFRVFDADDDGRISSEELQDVFTVLGDGECTLEDCRRMIDGIDSDGEGSICLQDFRPPKRSRPRPSVKTLLRW